MEVRIFCKKGGL